eukprot:Opistho-1_new@56187
MRHAKDTSTHPSHCQRTVHRNDERKCVTDDDEPPRYNLRSRKRAVREPEGVDGSLSDGDTPAPARKHPRSNRTRPLTRPSRASGASSTLDRAGRKDGSAVARSLDRSAPRSSKGERARAKQEGARRTDDMSDAAESTWRPSDDSHEPATHDRARQTHGCPETGGSSPLDGHKDNTERRGERSDDETPPPATAAAASAERKRKREHTVDMGAAKPRRAMTAVARDSFGPPVIPGHTERRGERSDDERLPPATAAAASAERKRKREHTVDLGAASATTAAVMRDSFGPPVIPGHEDNTGRTGVRSGGDEAQPPATATARSDGSRENATPDGARAIRPAAENAPPPPPPQVDDMHVGERKRKREPADAMTPRATATKHPRQGDRVTSGGNGRQAAAAAAAASAERKRKREHTAATGTAEPTVAMTAAMSDSFGAPVTVNIASWVQFLATDGPGQVDDAGRARTTRSPPPVARRLDYPMSDGPSQVNGGERGSLRVAPDISSPRGSQLEVGRRGTDRKRRQERAAGEDEEEEDDDDGDPLPPNRDARAAGHKRMRGTHERQAVGGTVRSPPTDTTEAANALAASRQQSDSGRGSEQQAPAIAALLRAFGRTPPKLNGGGPPPRPPRGRNRLTRTPVDDDSSISSDGTMSSDSTSSPSDDEAVKDMGVDGTHVLCVDT